MTGSAAKLLEAASHGDRRALARLVSMVEDGGDLARDVGRLVFPLAGSAYSVGITGPPGAGKSSLCDRLVAHLRAARVDVGVLAVDPTSPFSGGALLGDRVRMQGHASDPGVFVRSMATRGHLGGLALAVPEVLRVLDAAGLAVLLVETVGVGQVEVEVAGATDTTVVILTPGTGDSIQAAKAGLLEVAEVFVVNKADRPGTRELRADLEAMLALARPAGGWPPPIVETVATEDRGIAETWEAVAAHRRFQEATGALERRRLGRLEAEVIAIVGRRLEERTRARLAGPELADLADELSRRRLDPHAVAARILARWEETSLHCSGPGPAVGPDPASRS